MDTIIAQIAEPMGALLLVLINALIVLVTNWVRVNIKNKTAASSVESIIFITETVVKGLNQDVVEALKDDGKFDKKEQFLIKKKALGEINKHVPDAIMKSAGLAVKDIDAFISTYIERAVAESKTIKD